MSKYDELERLSVNVHETMGVIEKNEQKLLHELMNGLVKYLECPSAQWAILRAEANKAAGEVLISPHAIRDKKGRAVGRIKIVLSNHMFELAARVRYAGGKYDVSCFDATSLVDLDDSSAHEAFHESVFQRLKDHIEQPIKRGLIHQSDEAQQAQFAASSSDDESAGDDEHYRFGKPRGFG
ncbi:hypothetical protein [Sorangium sp. So ce887]|uniref:hypothetical protein n=1 Tax=Sorangium sp. So ce887 TaxID=3133324 RepID=UPI003F60768F